VVGGVRSVPGRNEARRIGGIGDPPRRRFGFSPTVREALEARRRRRDSDREGVVTHPPRSRSRDRPAVSCKWRHPRLDGEPASAALLDGVDGRADPLGRRPSRRGSARAPRHPRRRSVWALAVPSPATGRDYLPPRRLNCGAGPSLARQRNEVTSLPGFQGETRVAGPSEHPNGGRVGFSRGGSQPLGLCGLGPSVSGISAAATRRSETCLRSART
jgi:hypothetical protein